MSKFFIAIDLPQNILEEIQKIQNIIKDQNLFEGRFTTEKHLHITLKFLGKLNKDEIFRVKEDLKKIKFHKFSVALKNINFFLYKKNKIAIIWIGVESDDLLILQKQISSQLKWLDVEEKNKSFIAHVTIARVKSIKNKISFNETLQKITIPSFEFIVSDFLLQQSLIADNHLIHEEIEKYYLD